MKIAVIGTGISGLSAAYALRNTHDVTVYEKEPRAGGHSNTLNIDYDGTRIAVDTGFIVFNTLTYPNLVALFEHLAIETIDTHMSFSVSLDNGQFEWAGNRDGLFAQKSNLVSPRYFAMLRDILRFNRQAPRDLEKGALAELSLGQYLAQNCFCKAFAELYLLPMGAAIWSASCAAMLEFPADSFLTFCNNHRLLHLTRPVWRTVRGGSQVYVGKMLNALGPRVRLRVQADRISRSSDGVTITDISGGTDHFDHVVIASHSDEALKMLADPTKDERSTLGAIPYAPNVAYLHRDLALMPRRKAVWASWNFIGGPPHNASAPAGVTYWMNRLQSIDMRYPLFVSLNPPRTPDPALTFARLDYAHPQFSRAAMAAQKRLDILQGQNRTWFAGAYCGYGFHEDGLKAGLKAALGLGGALPWATPAEPAFLEAAQ